MELAILYSLLIFAVIATAALGAILGLMPSKDDVRETREAVRVINAQLKSRDEIERSNAEWIKAHVMAVENDVHSLGSRFMPTTTTEKCKACEGAGEVVVTAQAPLLQSIAASVRDALGKKSK